MAEQLELILTGAVVVLDTVLLVAMLERRNLRVVSLSMVLLLVAVWLWHVASFVLLLLADLQGAWSVTLRHVFAGGMAGGLLLLPCALAHGAFRLWRSGFTDPRRLDPRYAWAYAPLAALAFLPWRLETSGDGGPWDALAPFLSPYLAVLAILVTAIACVLLRLGKQERTVVRRRPVPWLAVPALAVRWMAGVFLVESVVLTVMFVLTLRTWPTVEESVLLFLLFLPVLPSFLFGYLVVRFNFLGLIVERTFVYAGILLGAFLFHEVVVEDLASNLGEKYRVDFGLVEGVAIVALVLAYQPLRQRSAEALRYLMGVRVAHIRDRTRDLALELARNTGGAPTAILDRFCEQARLALRLTHVEGWLFGEVGEPQARASKSAALVVDEAHRLFESLAVVEGKYLTPEDSMGEVLDTLRKAEASCAVRFDGEGLALVVVFGKRSRNRELSDEDLNSLVLLVNQLGVAMSNSRLQAERLVAERRAFQNEKLSAIGLLTSSIAHEVKNPLSSIKTITTVLSEEVGEGGKFAEDLRLVRGEVERLEERIREWLDFARPAKSAGTSCSLVDVVRRTAGVIGHLARQGEIVVALNLSEELPRVAADQAALREIVFNLMSNALEAVDAGGTIEVSCRESSGLVILEVADDGPGIPEGVQNSIFDPFVTSKELGTGLGLYICSRRARELGGELGYSSRPGGGTTFTLTLRATS